MKLKNRFALLLAAALAFGSTACTDHFEDINTPPSLATQVDPSLLFTRATVTGGGISYAVYQLMHQTTTGYWSQHFANIQPAFSGDTYEPGPANNPWGYYYSSGAFAPLSVNHQVMKLIDKIDKNPVRMAQAKIWQVYMFSLITDCYGDIPYSEAFESNTPKFDTQEAIYNDFFAKLDESIKSLKDNQSKGFATFGNADVLYKGDVTSWIRFANSLKLRLAMRLTNVDPTRAKALVASIPQNELIATLDQSAKVMMEKKTSAVTHHTKNPLGFIYAWNEVRASETMMNKLKLGNGIIDPRMYRYFEPNKQGQYVGLKNGQDRQLLSQNLASYKDNYCNIGPAYNSQDNDLPLYLLTPAEVNFLLAEAAQRGYIAGNAAEFYENGIKASMAQFEVTKTEGITQANIDAFLKAPEVAYQAGKGLEQIMTQKWVAFYTNSAQAWMDMRRTGFPVPAKPVVTFPGNEQLPRRMQYSTSEANYNRLQYEAAVQRMGGDGQYTRMWWDKAN